MTLGEKLFQLRKEKNLSQEEVAEKLNVSRQTISKWETDQSSPDLDKIVPLCELYEISTDYLLTGKKKEKRKEEEKQVSTNQMKTKEVKAKKTALGVFIYFIAIIWIMISIPVMDMDPIIASAIFLGICGIATYEIVYTAIIYKKEKKIEIEDPNKKLMKQMNEVISLIILVIYLVVSFMTMAWHITWILWIVNALIEEIVKLVFQLKEEKNAKE